MALSDRGCQVCLASFTPERHAQIYCSVRCRAQGQHAKSRERAHRVRGNSRFSIMERDAFRCRYCGAGADDGAVLEVDHIRPRAAGGTDDAANLVTACRSCNRGKHIRDLSRKFENGPARDAPGQSAAG